MIETEEEEEIISEAVAYASCHGISMLESGSKTLFSHAPFSLYPTEIPASEFSEIRDLAPIFNKLVDNMSRERSGDNWIIKTLRTAAKSDSFTGRLMEIYKMTLPSERKNRMQKWSLGLLRSDYFLDEKTGGFQQVELNTIAASFGGLSTRISEMHRYLNNRRGENATIAENNALKTLAQGLGLASKQFENELGLKEGEATVLMVVQKGERNSFDQRLLEYELWNSYGVKLVRRPLETVENVGRLVERDGKDILVLVEGETRHMISVAYFRAGYGPGDYPSEREWEGRSLIEKSFAIKCPNIAYHLLGTKKVQQELARPGQLELFLDDEELMRKLRKCFAGLYSLDPENQTEDEKFHEGRAADLNSCHEYVLKPQREGGGNNFYGKQIPTKLEQITKSNEKNSYILMQRIFPKVSNVLLVKQGSKITGRGVSEIGVFGVFLGNGTETVINCYGGYLVRTKLEHVDEGGVAAGFSSLSSLALV